jgi:hypothetical protein
MRFGVRVSAPVLLGPGVVGCGGSGSGPLIGKWQAANCVIDQLEFTAKTQSMHTIAVAGNAAYSETFPVTYDDKTSPNVVFVYVNGDRTRGTTYDIIDSDTIRMEDSGRCIYKRTG